MIELEELEAGTPKVAPASEDVEQQLPQPANEPEAGTPYYVPPKPDKAPAPKSFSAAEEYEKLVRFLRQPRDYKEQQDRMAKNAKYLEAVSAINLLLNTAKGAFGGTVRKEDYSALQRAVQEAQGYEAAAAKDADRYADEQGKLMRDLYNLQLKEDANERSYQKELDRILAKAKADEGNIKLRDELARGQIELRGEVAATTEGVKQAGRERLVDKRFGHQVNLEALKQAGRESLAAIKSNLTASNQLNKPYIDVKAPNGAGTIGLTKGEALEFFNWLLSNGDITQGDVQLMVESFSGSAANNIVQSKVADYARRYPDALTPILRDRGRFNPPLPQQNAIQPQQGVPQSKGNPLQSRQPQGKGNPFTPR